MGVMIWLEETGLADWVRRSAFGYPSMITLHSIGMAIMVGLSITLNLRILGSFKSIPYATLHGYLRLAWVGFIINFLSGCCLFAASAATFGTQTSFLLKISLVFLGAISVGWLQRLVGDNAGDWTNGPVAPGIVRNVALGSTIVWVSATIVGRMTAYI